MKKPSTASLVDLIELRKKKINILEGRLIEVNREYPNQNVKKKKDLKNRT